MNPPVRPGKLRELVVGEKSELKRRFGFAIMAYFIDFSL